MMMMMVTTVVDLENESSLQMAMKNACSHKPVL